MNAKDKEKFKCIKHESEKELENYAKSNENLEKLPSICLGIVVKTYEKDNFSVSVRYADDNFL